MLANDQEQESQVVSESMDTDPKVSLKVISEKILLEDELLPEDDASDAEWMSEASADLEDDEEFDEEMVIEDVFAEVSAQVLDIDTRMESGDDYCSNSGEESDGKGLELEIPTRLDPISLDNILPDNARRRRF